MATGLYNDAVNSIKVEKTLLGFINEWISLRDEIVSIVQDLSNNHFAVYKWLKMNMMILHASESC